MKIKIITLMIFCIGLSSCTLPMILAHPTIERWADKRTIEKYDEARDAYYDKETQEQKQLRKENLIICNELSERPENRIPRKGFPNGISNQQLYRDCMKKRGSPLFERKK